jgi:hypothetical protein
MIKTQGSAELDRPNAPSLTEDVRRKTSGACSRLAVHSRLSRLRKPGSAHKNSAHRRSACCGRGARGEDVVPRAETLTANDTPGGAESETFAIGRIVQRARSDTASLDGQDWVASTSRSRADGSAR